MFHQHPHGLWTCWAAGQAKKVFFVTTNATQVHMTYPRLQHTEFTMQYYSKDSLETLAKFFTNRLRAMGAKDIDLGNNLPRTRGPFTPYRTIYFKYHGRACSIYMYDNVPRLQNQRKVKISWNLVARGSFAG
jgi:hypothetical protein